jgi:hypothetical protein
VEIALFVRPGPRLRGVAALGQELLHEREDRPDVGVGHELGRREDVTVGSNVVEPGRAKPGRQGSRKSRMGEVLVPRAQRALHAGRIRRVPGHGRPVDVPDDGAPSRTEHPIQLGEREVRVGDVLDHLHGEDGIEAAVVDRQGRRVGLVEGRVRTVLDPAGGDGEHLRAVVDPDDEAGVADLLEQLGDVEAGAAADVEDPLAGRGGQRLADEGAAAEDVPGPVDGLELLRQTLVEDEPAH